MRTTTLLLTIAAAAGTLSLSAANVRIDLNGISNGIVLQPGESGGFSVRRAGWEEKEKQDKTLNLEKALAADYQDYTFSFTADKAGYISFTICGNWAPDAANRPYLLLDDVTVNGELLPNGDFEAQSADGKITGWNMQGKPTLSNEAKSGSSAIRINHDNRIAQSLKVEPGKSYTVKFSAKETK